MYEFDFTNKRVVILKDGEIVKYPERAYYVLASRNEKSVLETHQKMAEFAKGVPEKVVAHHTQPYGWVKFNARLVPVIENGFPKFIARGVIIDSSWNGTLIAGRPIGKANKSKIGQREEIRLRSFAEWEDGKIVTVAM